VKAKKTLRRVQDRQALLYRHRAPIALCQNKENAMIPHSNGIHNPARQRSTTTLGNSQRPNPLETEDSPTLLFSTTDATAVIGCINIPFLIFL